MTKQEAESESSTAASAPSSAAAATHDNRNNNPINPARIALLRQGSTPSLEPTCPNLVHRWLYSNDKLWKPFNVLDSRSIDQATELCNREKLLKQAAAEAEAEDNESAPIQYVEPDPSRQLETWRVPVLEDKMWEVDLRRNKLCSVFWKSPESSIMRATWFYESTKLMPASDSLAQEIETLYQEIKPWTSSYCDELKSSVALGAEGEGKLKCDLKTLKGSYVIFIGPFLARIYSENFSSRLSKTILTAFSGEHGGGSLLIRGFDNNDRFLKSKSGAAAGGGETNSNSNSSQPNNSSSKKHNRVSSIASSSSTNSSASNQNPNPSSTPALSSYESLTKRLSAQLGRPVKASSSSSSSPSSKSPRLESRSRVDSSSSDSGVTTPTKSKDSNKEEDSSETSSLPTGAAEPDDKLDSGQGQDDSKKPRSDSSGSLPPPQSIGTSSDLFKTFTSKFNYWGLPAGFGGGGNSGGNASGDLEVEDEEAVADSKARETAKEALESSRPSSSSQEDSNEKESGDRSESKEKEKEVEEESEEEEMKRELENQSRPVEIVFCLHGIGQRLASMPGWGNLDFTIALNAFRTLVQNRAQSNPPSEIGGEGFRAILNGRRVQFIPVMWRSTLEDFKPRNQDEEEEKDRSNQNYTKNEFDLKDILGESDSIPLVKSLIEGVLLDIPLYLSQHKEFILRRVKKECNRLYRLFLQRNPDFLKNGGKVNLLGHSLGTALAVDILSHQPTFISSTLPDPSSKISKDFLEFDTKTFIMCGSPVALFLWLNQSPLIARRGRESVSDSIAEKRKEKLEESFSLDRVGKYGCLAVDRIANVFFTSDPIATRLNSTVDSKLSKQVKTLDVKKAVNTLFRCLPGANQELTATESSGSRLFAKWNKSSANENKQASSSQPLPQDQEQDQEQEDGLNLDGAEGLFGRDVLEENQDDHADRDGDGDGDRDGNHQGGKKEKKKDQSWISKITPSPTRKGQYANRPSVASKIQDRKLSNDWQDVQNPQNATEVEKGKGTGNDEQEEQGVQGQEQEQQKEKEKEETNDEIPDRSSTPTQDSTDKEKVKTRAESETGEKEHEKDKEKDKTEGERERKLYDESVEKEIAQRKFNALNPLGVIDFSIPVAPSLISHQYMSYVSMLFSHAGYWNDSAFADFTLAMLFASDEQLTEARKKGNWK